MKKKERNKTVHGQWVYKKWTIFGPAEWSMEYVAEITMLYLFFIRRLVFEWCLWWFFLSDFIFGVCSKIEKEKIDWKIQEI